MKTIKIIITDKRQVYRIQRCWYYERHPSTALNAINDITKAMLQFGIALRPAVESVNKALKSFKML